MKTSKRFKNTGAVHTDLYYKMDVIPFNKIEAFHRKYLK